MWIKCYLCVVYVSRYVDIDVDYWYVYNDWWYILWLLI